MARNTNENPASGTSRPLATSSLARSLRDLNAGSFRSHIWDLQERSTCGKSTVDLQAIKGQDSSSSFDD